VLWYKPNLKHEQCHILLKDQGLLLKTKTGRIACNMNFQGLTGEQAMKMGTNCLELEHFSS